MTQTDGLLVIDKPSGMTSHDVVGKVRKKFGLRKVGHAGTLDPMATGVLVIGLGRATRMLGYLTLDTKCYEAVIRLGQSTVTDDAEGEVVASADASTLASEAIRGAVASLTGEILQVPSAVSAIKVGGKRSYRRIRDGEDVQLAPRAIVVEAFEIKEIGRSSPELVDVTVAVRCSSGTYVRALARDLGNELAVGGHLTKLRRTASGAFDIKSAVSLDAMSETAIMSLADAARRTFPVISVDEDAAADVRHGRPLSAAVADPVGATKPAGSDQVFAVLDESGAILALMKRSGDQLRVAAGFTG